ncbi:MAG: hypothetical protein JRJ17_08905 [Deltaproteobacteria bacterium]|nr:hypothetical protein [Deltaproteobacteria bacterium]
MGRRPGPWHNTENNGLGHPGTVGNAIQVGDLIENNFRVAISDLPSGEERKFDAILGMDLLNKYKVQIDSENSRLVLSPGRRSGH